MHITVNCNVPDTSINLLRYGLDKMVDILQ